MGENARDVLAICWLAHDNDWTVTETRQWMAKFDIANNEEFMGPANLGAEQTLAALDAAGFAMVPKVPTGKEMRSITAACPICGEPLPADPPKWQK